MAHIGTKGYYVKKLKELYVRQIDKKPLEQFKTHVLANLYEKVLKNNNKT